MSERIRKLLTNIVKSGGMYDRKLYLGTLKENGFRELYIGRDKYGEREYHVLDTVTGDCWVIGCNFGCWRRCEGKIGADKWVVIFGWEPEKREYEECILFHNFADMEECLKGERKLPIILKVTSEVSK